MTAGAVWLLVALYLLGLALGWISEGGFPGGLLVGLAGIGLALAIHRLGFSRVARRNLDRIGHYPDKVCLFAFQAWQSYLVVVLMILLGKTLRRLPIPHPLLAVLYCGIGGGLGLSSLLYFRSAKPTRAG